MVLAMELLVLGCQGGPTPVRHLPGLLLDGTVLLEAGSVTSTLGLAEQLRIEHVLLSHATSTTSAGWRISPTTAPERDAWKSKADREEHTMLDVLFIGLALGFLALSWGLVELCDRL